jgi:hypothetical protein
MTDATAPNHNGAAFADTPEYRQQLLGGRIRGALLVGLVGWIAFLGLLAIYYTVGPSEGHRGEPTEATGARQPFLSFLTGYMFWTVIGLGSIFFLLLQYITGGRWGILLRRPLEAATKALFLIGVPGFIGIALTMSMGENSIYWWARHHAHMGHHEAAEHKEPGQTTATEPVPPTAGVRADVVHPELMVDEEAKIRDWLNPSFAVVRGFVYLAIFGALVWWMWSNAKTAEYHENLDVAYAARDRQKYVGSFGLFVFAVFLTAISTDWVMSLDETFASSMFPVIVFDNAAVSAYALGLLVLLYLKRRGDPRFNHLFPGTEQIHLGSLFLAFILAWTYFNFSQYMLIWIGNLPEEIPYYLKRTRGGWGWYAGLAVVFHFPIPFLLLLFRRVKSSPTALRNIALMILLVIFFDVLWWIAPAINHTAAPKWYLLMDVAATVGIGGLWLAAFFWFLKKHPLLPTREVYLLEAYHHGH